MRADAPAFKSSPYLASLLRPSALEHLLHRVFASVRLDASVLDGVGGTTAATEWFVVPLTVIDRAIELIMSDDIVHYVYDPAAGQLVERPS